MAAFLRWFWILVGSSLLIWSGCARRGPSAPRWTVGVTLLTRAHAFYNDLEAGMQEEAAKRNLRLLIVSGEWDLVKQTEQVRDFITRKVDAIVICPVNSQGIGTAVKEANQAGIPVFTADIANEGGGEVLCHVASDNYRGGWLVGRYLAKALGGQGKVLIIDQPTVTSVIQRVKGFEDALKDFPSIHIVAKPRAEKGLRPIAKSVTEDYLQRYPDLKGIFGSNDDCALGALQAVRAAGREDILIVGFDATDEARSEILKGSPLKADAVQFPRKIGAKTMEVVAEYLETRQRPPAFIPIEVALVDKEALEKGKYLYEVEPGEKGGGER